MNLEKVNKLVDVLKCANFIAIEAGQNEEDGGTCNFDTPTIKLDRWTEEEIKEASELSGVTIGEKLGGWHKGYRFIFIKMDGQANRRTRMAEAAKKFIALSGYDVSMYYQMD